MPQLQSGPQVQIYFPFRLTILTDFPQPHLPGFSETTWQSQVGQEPERFEGAVGEPAGGADSETGPQALHGAIHGTQPLALPPIVREPADGTILREKDISFQWLKVGDASGYHLQIARDKEFADKNKKLDEKLATEKGYENWTYLVSSWTLDSVLKDRGQLLVEKKPETKPGDTNAAPAKITAPGLDEDQSKEEDKPSPLAPTPPK